MRLIDADAMEEDLGVGHTCEECTNKWCYDQRQIYSVSDICEWLSEQPTIDPVAHGKWTPCSERLPDEYQECLVTTYKGDIHCARYSKGLEWDVDEYSCYLHVDDVIAWMPLPEPYKERSEQ